MSKPESQTRDRSRGLSVLALGAALALPATAFAQPMPADHSAHPPATAPADKPLADQVGELRAKVSKLEMALQHRQMGMGPSTSGMQPMSGMGQDGGGAMPGMGGGTQPMRQMQGTSGAGGAMPAGAPMAGSASGGMGGGMGMGMMQSEMGGMGGGAMPAATTAAGMTGGGGRGMGMDKMEMAGMMGMPPMGSGAAGAMSQSMLPGFPGASHLYHIGATDFFLDHPQHIALTTEQQAALNKAKEQALLAKSTADRAIAQAEQELWTLTSSDQPDAAKIEAKIGEIGKLTGEERLAFIRAVGDASKILTDDQRKILTGFALPAPAAPAAPAMAPGGMKDM